MGLGDARVTYNVVTKTRAPQLQVVDLDRSDEDEVEFQRVAPGTSCSTADTAARVSSNTSP